MTETSYFWDGTTLGDASLAPYDDTEMADAMQSIARNVVIPGSGDGDLGDELRVGFSGNTGTVLVNIGAAMVGGILYVNDALYEPTIASNASGNPRIDRVVIERDDVAQTARVDILQGTPGATPSPPNVATTKYTTLAWVYVPNGYDSAVDTPIGEYIFDERNFFNNGYYEEYSYNTNLLSNPSFIAWSSGASPAAPDKWSLISTPVVSINTKSQRGVGLDLTTGPGTEGVETTVTANMLNDEALFTLRVGVEVQSGTAYIQIYRINLSTNSATLERTKTLHPVSTTLRYIIIRELITYTSNFEAVAIRVVGGTGADQFYFYDPSLSMGYKAIAPFKHEVIMLDNAMALTNWTASARSSSSQVVSLSTEFAGTYIWPASTYLRGVIMRVRCRDSGSAGATDALDCAVTLHHHYDPAMSFSSCVGAVSCAARANDSWAEDIVYLPINHNDNTGSFRLRCWATGAGTLDVTLEVIGYIT